MKHKLLSILLCLAMALSLLPTAALADEGEGAKVGDTEYTTLQAAIDAAKSGETVTLLADTRENVTISTPYVTLDLNGHTLNGGTEKGKPALTITARVTVMDSSATQTGTIMREDTAENSGVSSHYVIDVQGDGWLTFESGNVTNNSGNTAGKGASLVRVGDDSVAKYPGLNIKGGTFTQNNFIVIKVDRGDLFLNGGTLSSENSYTVENWHRATIKGGTVNGDVTSVNYGNADKVAKVAITGGTVNGTLGTFIYSYSNGLTATEDTSKATIEVTGGTFSKDPSAYLVEGSTATQNGDGTYGVAKAYLAKVGDTSCYTMEEAFKEQTASGKPIVLLRDYTTGSTFNSGSISRTVDLNGHTWTCTGKDANSAAFAINYPNAALTVKNGKIVSSQLVGLIPSASSLTGPITYDNSSLTFENVEMTTTATSGIETNGNNTNDSVTLRNSTLNVPNGFGIYFPSSGTLTIDNSTISAKTMGVQVCAGSLNINDGSKITVNGDAVPKTESDGAIQDGAAISIVNRDGYKGLGKIEVTGGTFKANGNNAAIKAYGWNNTNKKEDTFTESDKVSVSGGTFSSTGPENCSAPGFVPKVNSDGTYGVEINENENRVAEVLDAQGKTVGAYGTLAAAITAAKNGEPVKLLKDVTENVTIPADKTITLDLNGKKLVNSENAQDDKVADADRKHTITNNGTLTIKDSVGGGIVDNVSHGRAAIYNAGTITEIKGGKFTRSVDNSTDAASAKGNSWYVIYNAENATINKISGGEFLAIGKFSSLFRSDGTIDEISGGTFTQDGFIAFKNQGTVKKISGGTFSSKEQSCIQNWGTIDEVCGGTITVGSIGIWNLSSDKYAAPGKVGVISGGSISGTTAAIRLTDYDNTPDGGNKPSTTCKASASITGGTITGALDVRENTKLTISGGTFDRPIDSKYCASGFVPKANSDGTYGVTRPSSGSSSSSSYDPTYSVSTPSKTEHGTVTVSPKSASKGDRVTVTVKPDSGYVLETLTVTDKNGNELTLKDKGNGKYTFTMPAGKVEVKATFMEDNSMLNFFYDVPNNAYFYEAVKWAVENGITTGVGNDLFAPEQPCTRAQIVTFLWRAAGSPEPKGAASGMTDVVSGSYYEKAVAWAIENGITTGTTTTMFSPNVTCTRAQAVTFLARALKAKAASAAEFSDVPTGSYFADAVAWAAANGVTEGIGGGLFGSDNDCTRGQIVTFLYRAYNK